MKTKINNLFLIVVFTAVIVTMTMSVTKYVSADRDHHHSQKDHHNHHHSQKDHHNHHHSQKDHHNHHHSQKDHSDKTGNNSNASTVANLTSTHPTTPIQNNLTSIHNNAPAEIKNEIGGIVNATNLTSTHPTTPVQNNLTSTHPTTPVQNNLTSIHNNAPAEIKNEIGGIVNATNLTSTHPTTPVQNNVISGSSTTSEKHTLNLNGLEKTHKIHSSKHKTSDIFNELSGQTVSGNSDQNNVTKSTLSPTRTGYNPINDNAGNMGNSNSAPGMLLPFM